MLGWKKNGAMNTCQTQSKQTHTHQDQVFFCNYLILLFVPCELSIGTHSKGLRTSYFPQLHLCTLTISSPLLGRQASLLTIELNSSLLQKGNCTQTDSHGCKWQTMSREV